MTDNLSLDEILGSKQFKEIPISFIMNHKDFQNKTLIIFSDHDIGRWEISQKERKLTRVNPDEDNMSSFFSFPEDDKLVFIMKSGTIIKIKYDIDSSKFLINPYSERWLSYNDFNIW